MWARYSGNTVTLVYCPSDYGEFEAEKLRYTVLLRLARSPKSCLLWLTRFVIVLRHPVSEFCQMRRTTTALITLCCLGSRLFAGNPLIPTVYSADPSAHVWPGDERIWLYCSTDEPGTNTNDTMVCYHVYSSTNLVDWTDYGIALHLNNVRWAASHMWAPDCVLRHGIYTLVYCAKEKWSGSFRTGLATSTRPEGPFKDIGYIQGIEGGQDPAVFIDDDGTPYILWGSGGTCHGAVLSDDLRSVVPGTTVDLTKQLTYVYEGPWLHKYNGKYYLSYPGLVGGEWPEKMFYAVADKPLGPFTFKGCYIPEFKGQSGTNHGSIISYKNQWLAFHHSTWVSGGLSEVRNLMCDRLEYDLNGDIKPITPSEKGVSIDGVPKGPSQVTVMLEAEDAPANLGDIRGASVGAEAPGFGGSGYVTHFEGPGASISLVVQSSKARRADLKIRYRLPGHDESHKVRVNATQVPDPVGGYTSWEKRIVFPRSESWTEMDLGPVELKEGDNVLRFIAAEKGDIAVDRFTLSPQVDRVAMVGDSITHMGDWKTVLGRNDVVNWGIPGYTTGQIEWTFKDLVQQESGLKVVFLEGGINDLTLGVPPNVVYENEIRAIAYWRNRGVMPILQSIIFKVDSPETNAVIADLNARLREYCGAEHVDYVDLNAVLSDSKGLRADLSIDGTHLNPPAYELWAGEIRKTLDRLKL